jgi:hypothetical protein
MTIPFKLFDYQRRVFEDMMQGQFNCVDCKKLEAKKHGQMRVSFMTRTGRAFWSWFCKPCYEKRFKKNALHL